LPNLIKEHFADSLDNVITEPFLFGDYMTATPLDPDSYDIRLYEDCGSFERVGVKFN